MRVTLHTALDLRQVRENRFVRRCTLAAQARMTNAIIPNVHDEHASIEP
jgi:hypothetical protein